MQRIIIGLFIMLATGGLLFGDAVALKDGEDAAWRRELLPLPHELAIGKIQRLKPSEIGVRGRAGAVGLEQVSVSNVVELFREKTGLAPEGKGFEILIGVLDDKGKLEGIDVPQIKQLNERPNRDQAYVIQPVGEKMLVVAALSDRGLYYGTRTLSQWLELHLTKDTAEIPLASVVDWPDLEERGFWHMPVSLVPWLASMKMNRFFVLHNFTVDNDGIHPTSTYNEKDAKVRQEWTPPYAKARMFAAEVVPGPTHMDFWETRFPGFKEAYPGLIGKGESAKDPFTFTNKTPVTGITGQRVPCASNPDLVKILTVVMTNLAAQKASEVMVWMSEYPAAQCECEKCMKEGQYRAEVRSTLEAWKEARKTYPDLKVSVFFGMGGYWSSPELRYPLPKGYPDQEIKDIVASLPPDATMRASGGCDGPDGKLLADFAAKGKRITRMDTKAGFLSGRYLSDDIRRGIENNVVSGKYIGAWSFTSGGYPDTDSCKKWYNYRASAFAEYEWNAKGRNAEEFAEAWAVRQGFEPGLFTEWLRVINSPVGRRMTQAWGANVQQTWLARLPKDMSIGDFNVSGTDTPEKNAVDARRALTAAEKMGDKSLILAARSLAAYCELEASGYEWMRRDAEKTKAVANDRPSHKELRERVAAAIKKYIDVRQEEIKGRDLGSRAYDEKVTLDGSAPLEKARDLFLAEPP